MKALRSLHARFIATYMLLALILLGSTGVIFYNAFRGYADRVYRDRINQQMAQAQAYVGSVQEEDPEVDPELVLVRLTELFPELEFELRTVTSPTTAVVGVPEPGQGGAVEPSLFSRGGGPGGRPQYFGLIPGRTITQIMAGPRNQQPPVFQTFYREVAILVAMGLAVAGLMGFWLSRWLSRPIASLAGATAAVGQGDFLQAVPPTGTPELDRLVQQFNRMVQRLNESFRSLSAERDVARRFASDAAHELKTPLAALRAYHETVMDRPERLPQVLPGMGRQIDRIERIIAGLLQLARLSEGTGMQLTQADAADALRALEPGFRALVEDYEHQFTVRYPADPLPVRLDGRLVEIALTNLVENACKFTPAGGQITLELDRQDGEAVIAVIDSGPGIDPEELPHIFERFHRAADTQAIPGSGLGLSIVQEAATRMGGRVTVETERGRGSRFALHLPLATGS